MQKLPFHIMILEKYETERTEPIKNNGIDRRAAICGDQGSVFPLFSSSSRLVSSCCIRFGLVQFSFLFSFVFLGRLVWLSCNRCNLPRVFDLTIYTDKATQA